MSKNLEEIFITVVGILGWTNNTSRFKSNQMCPKQKEKVFRLDLKLGMKFTILTFFGNWINSNIRIGQTGP